MAQCRILIGKEMDPVTGEVLQKIFVDPNVANKNNDCAHFKKRFFSKNKEKKYCVDCRNIYGLNDCWV